jgi:hypothetical protein
MYGCFAKIQKYFEKITKNIKHSVKDVCYKSQLASDADKIYVPHQCIAGKTGFLIS